MELYDRPSFDRLSGLAFFTPEGESGAIPLGNIEMMKLEVELNSRDYVAPVRNQLQLRKRKVTGRVPIYSIHGNQFPSVSAPLLLLGQRETDYVQLAANDQTFIFTAVPGRGFQ